MKEKRMTCEKARNVCLVATLAKLGHFPVRKTDKEAWFLSPFRAEARTSFKVSRKLNRWYDHGEGTGGNAIDLVVRIKGCPVREALDFLGEGENSFFFRPPHPFPVQVGELSIRKTKPIEHRALQGYLAQRNIPLGSARQFCREVHYGYNGKPYFAIGLPNAAGGWELRNKYCKNSTSPKDISLFNYGRERLIVAEGMFDLLSLLSYDPSLITTSDFLVLNSLSFVEKAMEICKGYTAIELYLDNDNAGRRATDTFLEQGKNYIDRSNLYQGHKDLNEMWAGKKG